LSQTLNLGILAHVDAGKTSLTERLLYENGTIKQLGSVDAGSTQTDTSDLERQRGITIRSAVASFMAGDLQINLIDTPGHPDFIAEVERALSVLDGAVLVMSAVEGVQAQTRVLMRSLKKLQLPTLIFVNKIDRVGARYDDLLVDIRRKLAPGIIAMSSVRDLGTSTAHAVPLLLERQDFRTQVAEILADNDDGLLARIVEGSVPSPSELQSLLVKQTESGLLHPVFFGSALTGQGASELTNGISTLLRPPGDLSADSSGTRGTVFAIERTSSGEKIAYLRLFSGELEERERVTFHRHESGGRVSEFTGKITGLEVIGGQVPASSATRRLSVPGQMRSGPSGEDTLTAGNIAKLRGLSEIRVGDQLGEAGSPDHQLHFSPPSLESVVRSRQPEQAALLHSGLMNLADEDPLIRTRPAGGGATSVLLYGAVQQEVIAARLEHEFGVEAVFEHIQPVYFERPVGISEALTEFDRRGPNDFWATVGLRIEPAPIGAGNSFVREVEWGALPRAFHRAIEDAVLNTLEQGLNGWEVTDCTVTLTQVGRDAPITVAADFRNLTPLVLMRALKDAGTQVFEPCHSVEVEVPSDMSSAVVGSLTSLGADIKQSAEKGTSWLITAELPARLVQKFTAALPGLSHGEGAVWSYPGTDRPVRGAIPLRERFDGNPLNYEEYMRFLSNRGGDRRIGATAGEN